MKKITLLALTTFALIASASAKNLGNTQPVVKNLSNAERVAEYNKTANTPMIGGAEGNKLCSTPRGILQQQSDEDRVSGKEKGYWVLGQSYTYVVKNHVDVVGSFMPWDALKLQQVNANEAIYFYDELHVSKNDDKHISGSVTFGYNQKQYFDVDLYEFDSDPSTYGQTRVCLTTMDWKER
ncbi:hypothetical protein Dxin01_00854 [Deinococcus xinjiangensis]|uniref:Uncharacterized protein n=1 Tax=Deinococcus xinjiangensis TaxID=457454 RepID=A0ABP9VAT2_9DEIO